MDKKISFNEAISELEIILKQIESGEMDLDDLTSKVKRASALIEICNKKLRSTEEELDKIVKDLE
ncbi:MAG: exodeoxyribonuclease VII small subunit [Marinilabiliaceae bacterium]|jgi:exodeoxyribonuclease VII small subunit|nr:exodeoxyribonuclease VII small subunit [Marinilabiliaceae bacterium]